MIEEVIDMPHCDNCKYSFYDPNDIKEHQRCRVISMNPKPHINSEIARYFAVKNNPLNCCEYFEKRGVCKK